MQNPSAFTTQMELSLYPYVATHQAPQNAAPGDREASEQVCSKKQKQRKSSPYIGNCIDIFKSYNKFCCLFKLPPTTINSTMLFLSYG